MNISEHPYDLVWSNVDSELTTELTAFWIRENALPAGASAEQRAQQVACIARDEEGAIAGVCTLYKQLNQHIGHPFLYYRSLVRSDQRQYGVARQLIVQTWDHLNRLAVNGAVDGSIGFCTIVENEILQTHKREAVWPLSRLIYIGKNNQGHHIRIRYFDGASI